MKITNKTAGEIVATVSYGGAGICSPETVKIASKATKIINSGVCCFKEVAIKSTSGTAQGSSVVYQAQRTGFGIGCKNQACTVLQRADNGLAVEGTSATGGHRVNMTNKTDGQLVLSISYGGPGHCAPDELLLEKGQTRTIHTAACCSATVSILATSGKASGKRFEYSPPRTGAGIACRSYSFTIKNTGDNGIIAETQK
jgi:hypothetical protein